MHGEFQKLLTIAIPTYNRCEFLKKNIQMLEQMILELEIEDEVEILVSDNASTDETSMLFTNVEEYKLSVIYNRNDENIGAVNNIVKLFESVKSKYIMILGDDDYISKDYLKRVLGCLHKDAGCVIPSYVNVNLQGKRNGRDRDIGLPSRVYEAGFQNCLENAWRGHQLSGITLKNLGLVDEIKEKEVYNYYLVIYAVAYRCMQEKTYHITDYPVLVTRPPQKKKDWGYGEDGLISDVFSNFVKLDITNYQKYQLQIKFLVDQYWRYAMYIKRGIGEFFKCIINIIKSPNTVWQTKVVFGLGFGFILIGKAVSLLFKGKLLDTLATKVDI